MARHQSMGATATVVAAALLGLTAGGASAAVPLNVGIVGDVTDGVTDLESVSLREPLVSVGNVGPVDIAVPMPRILPAPKPWVRPLPEVEEAQPAEEQAAPREDAEVEVVPEPEAAPEPARVEPAAPVAEAPAAASAPAARSAAPARPPKTSANATTLATVRNLRALLGGPADSELGPPSLSRRLREIDEAGQAQRVTQYAYPAASQEKGRATLPTAFLAGLGVVLVALHSVANRLRWSLADRRGLRTARSRD